MGEPSAAARSLNLTSRTVREIIGAYPQTVPVFERYGLMGCGGKLGPDEPLEFFARVHHVPLPEIRQALEEAIRPGFAARQPAARPAAPAARFPRYLLASLAITLTFGATLGMINLARLTGSWGLGSLPPASVAAHGYAQVFGFVALFVMGIAYHVVPRFLATELQFVRGTQLSFWLQLGGVALVTAAFIAGDGPWRVLWAAGSIALLGAAVLFAASIIATVRVSRSVEPFRRWIVAGAVWLVLCAAIAVAASARADPSLHRVLWPAALFGFAGSWIFGVGRRIFPVFLGCRTRWPRLERPVFVLYQVGVTFWSLGAFASAPIAVTVRLAGGAALLVASGLFVMMVGIFARRARAGRDPAAGYERYISAAWIWLFVALASGPGWLFWTLARGGQESALMLDYSAHALAFGFVTQMMMGVASRILPVFTGHRLWSPRARTAAFWLLNGAVVLRGLEAVVAAGYWPAAWPLIALSGPPAVAAVMLFAMNVVMTIARDTATDTGTAATIDLPDRTVAEVLKIPGALDVLVQAGFTPLAQPALRATLARTITLRQACAFKGLQLDPLVARLRALESRAPAGRARTIPLEVIR